MRLSGLSAALSWLVDTLWLSVLWLACVLLIVPAPAATAALVGLTAELQRDVATRGLTMAFLHQLRACFRLGSLTLGLWLALVALLAFNYSVVAELGPARVPVLIVLLGVTAMLVCFGAFLPLAVASDPRATPAQAIRAAARALARSPLSAANAILAGTLGVVLVLAVPLTILIVPGLVAHIAAIGWRRASGALPGTQRPEVTDPCHVG